MPGTPGEVGYALGRFHNLLSDLAPDHLSDTLPGFHLTPGYLAHYDEVLERRGARPSPEVNYGLRFVAERRAFAPVLEDARAQGRLRLRPMHGDPKVNNVMLDTATGQAVALVDLDTVKPGLVHYDIGDCLRSGCNPLGEETERLGNGALRTGTVPGHACKAIFPWPGIFSPRPTMPICTTPSASSPSSWD